MWSALLIQFILPIPRRAHPATLWHKFAQILATKVNTQGSYAQRSLSGGLASLLMLIPALLVLVALQTLVWQPALYDLALLLLALGWREQNILSGKLINALAKEDKQTARDLLAIQLNRQTRALSQVGLGKACTETLVVGQARQVIAVLFWYGILGGCGAFFFRLIIELHRAWSPAKPSFYPFGCTSAKIAAWSELLPVWLFSLLLMLGKNLANIWSQSRRQVISWSSFSTGWLLCVVGHQLNLSLGGPVIYEEKKTVRAKIGGRIVPSALHLSQVQRLLNQRTGLWIAGQSLIMLMIQGL
jgi:adenosylcobinamide-phosphate synthase